METNQAKTRRLYEVVWNQRLFRRSGFGRADVQAPVDQRRIDTDDFPAQPLRPFQRERGLARRGRTHQGNGERATVGGHGQTMLEPACRSVIRRDRMRAGWTSTARISTAAVENRWGKPVDNSGSPFRDKPLRGIGDFLTSRFQLSTNAVDKIGDSRVEMHRKRSSGAACRRYGEKMTSRNP